MVNYILNNNDTIVALATPLGNGALSVIRISGANALSVLNPHLSSPLHTTDDRRATFNKFRAACGSELIDQVIVTYFKSPRSYTGEDVIELSTHCNPLIVDRVMNELTKSGARIAHPGEFTFRAFMNGKLDLSQAEAVAETIEAKSNNALSHAVRHLEGNLSSEVRSIAESLLSNLALLEINLDFSDEEIETLPIADFRKKIEITIQRIDKLIRTYDYGKLLKKGLKLLILGKPNVGKSSILNMLAGMNRAIVSDIPGTTRDYVESHIEISGTSYEIVDTAGIRSTSDAIEAIGIEKAMEHLESTDIVLCVFDSHQPLTEDDEKLIEIIRTTANERKFIIILNKTDLGIHPKVVENLKRHSLTFLKLSTKTLSGKEELRETIKRESFKDGLGDSEEIVVTSLRHHDLLKKATNHLRNTITAIDSGASEEVIALDTRLALDAFGEITGENISENVLHHIFANFCIGK